MKENWQAIKDGWCPNCEPGKMTPMMENCPDCKSNPNKINCKSCSKPIYEGDKVLLIRWHDEEIIIHKRFECLLGVDGISEGLGSFEEGKER